MDTLNFLSDILVWLALTVAGTIVSIFVSRLLRKVRRPVADNTRVGRDGDFEVAIREEAGGGPSHKASRWYVVHLDVTNRGQRSTPAHESAILFVGRQEFPAEDFYGAAFERSIFPDSRASGEIAFRIPGHVVPTRVKLDVDGDGRAVEFVLGETKSPP